MAASAGSDAIAALYPLKPLPLSSPVSTCRVLSLSSFNLTKQEVPCHILIFYSIVNLNHSVSGEIYTFMAAVDTIHICEMSLTGRIIMALVVVGGCVG